MVIVGGGVAVALGVGVSLGMLAGSGESIGVVVGVWMDAGTGLNVGEEVGMRARPAGVVDGPHPASESRPARQSRADTIPILENCSVTMAAFLQFQYIIGQESKQGAK